MVQGKPFVITIVGAESSGKTTLGLRLAKETGCLFVPEYAREYLSSLGRDYDQKDLEVIAVKQWEIIQNIVSREPSLYMAPHPLKGALSNVRELSFDSRELLNLINSKIQTPKSKIIIDGGMMNLRMWAKIKYGITIPVVEDALRNDVTDLYLLCRPRTEWIADPLREAPTILERAWIYNQYMKELCLSPAEVEIVF